MSSKKRKPLKGVCYLYAETGTEGSYWAFQESRYILPPTAEFPAGQWPYKGLHILRNGDSLTIYSPDNPSKILWSGIIALREYSLFTEHVFNLWIHADQKGVKRETWAKWFLKEYPAELVTIKK